MTTTYSVPGVSGEHCRNAITDEVLRVTGVTGLIVNLNYRRVSVAGEFQDAAVREAIDNAGYDIAA
jgi:copper chaperone CopZ